MVLNQNNVYNWVYFINKLVENKQVKKNIHKIKDNIKHKAKRYNTDDYNLILWRTLTHVKRR